MQASAIWFLVGLLIAVFAIGETGPANADCRVCDGCPVEAPANNDAPCQQEALACQVAQTCAGQAQKAPAQLTVDDRDDARGAAFGFSSSIVVKLVYLTPETAPPRL